MDVERVQKINKLALELMKQGLVKEREEAIAQAEKMLAKKDCSVLQESMDNVKELKIEERGEDKMELSQDEIKNILKQNVDFMVKKFREFQGTIDKLNAEMNGLKNEMEELKSKGVRAEPMLKEVVQKAEEQPVKKEAPQQKLAETPTTGSDHPRSGNYKDNDVSIEKFFYSGTKRQD